MTYKTYLASFYEIQNEIRSGKRWWSWRLSVMAGQSDGRIRSPINETPAGQGEFEYKFETHESCMRMAEGWIRRNRPDLIRIAKNEFAEAMRYQRRNANPQ